MYSYNSSHKIVVIMLVIAWAIFHFSQRNDEGLYFDNGQVKQTGGTKNSLNDGMWTWFFEDGSVQMQGMFSKGMREGIWKTYTRDGLLVTESTYRANKLNGSYKKYDAKGELFLEQQYENDILIK